jgi:hypothetical protein
MTEDEKFIHELLEHLEWIGWGDSYERECSVALQKKAEEWLSATPK